MEKQHAKLAPKKAKYRLRRNQKPVKLGVTGVIFMKRGVYCLVFPS
jgi:hypothetical protein